MDNNTRNWQSEGPEDLQLLAEIINPLAEVATQIALAYEAIAAQMGAFCTACACIGYHIPSGCAGECELCGCRDIYWSCITCGMDRNIFDYGVGSKECKFCVNIQPVKIKPHAQVPIQDRFYFEEKLVTDYSRSREARLVLRELSD